MSAVSCCCSGTSEHCTRDLVLDVGVLVVAQDRRRAELVDLGVGLVPGDVRAAGARSCRSSSRRPRRSSTGCSGVQTSVGTPDVKPCGITPTTVYGSPRSLIAWPTMSAIAAEDARPEAVAQDGHRRPARAILVGGELAADERPDAEDGEVAGADAPLLDVGGRAVGHEIDAAAQAARRHRDVDRGRAVANREERLPVDRRVLAAAPRRRVTLRRSPAAPGSGNGSGLRSSALTTVKTAVLTPMPTASVTRAMTVKPGVLRSIRKA